EYDKNFEIVNTLVQNSDVFLLKNENPKSIGVAQNRNYQIDLVSEYYKEAKAIPFINSGLAYALEGNKVDGVIVDAIKSLSLQGEKISTSTNKDYGTYVLVVNKSFKKTDLYKEFISLYNKSVKKLENEKLLKKELERYIGVNLSNEEMGEFKSWKLKFLPIKE
ncbi:MAG: ABC transporter substrate-binding (seleno)protein SaoB, partial [Paraclostridium sp.]